MGVYKLLKEATIFSSLSEQYSSSMRVYAICVFSEDAPMLDFESGVTVLYEQVDSNAKLGDYRAWVRFLKRLHYSNTGSIAITDVKRDQFGMLRQEIIMFDMDDVYIDVKRSSATVFQNCRLIIKVFQLFQREDECVFAVLTPEAVD